MIVDLDQGPICLRKKDYNLNNTSKCYHHPRNLTIGETYDEAIHSCSNHAILKPKSSAELEVIQSEFVRKENMGTNIGIWLDKRMKERNRNC